MSDPDSVSVKVSRPNYRLEQINQSFCYEYPKVPLIKKLAKQISKIDCLKCVLSLFPFLGWLKDYSTQKDLPLDIISGCTVAIMHIPQGMGYALLANIPPIIGIYTAFFPVLVYFLFGTSRHNSMGTFAVVSIMVGKTVLKYSNLKYLDGEEGDVSIPDNLPSAIEVMTSLCFLIGLIQFFMFVFRLGIVSTLLSDTLVSGFTTGAAIHVFTSQVKDLFGLTLPKSQDNFDVVLTYYEIFKIISKINWVAFSISVVTCLILIFNNELLKPRVAKLTIIPIPIELILVVGGTLLSKYLNLAEVYDINTIKTIPLGFPEPVAPNFGLMKSLIADAFIIATVSYTVTVSMALIFANKEKYKVEFNQELLAMGFGNMFGSFFRCLPIAASLSRSVIQHTVGGKTQIASLVSCGILVVILLWIGSFFEPLPKAVLASIIIISLKGLLWQSKELFAFWRLSMIDGIIWLATFLSVVLIAIDIGLMVGICLSVLTLLIKGLKPYVCLLGNVPGTEIYLDTSRYSRTEEIPNVKIFHYAGCLNFASREFFKKSLYKLIQFEPKLVKDMGSISKEFPNDLKCVVIDLSSLGYVDASGVKTLRGIIDELNRSLISVFLASTACPVYETLKKCEVKLEDQGGKFKIFPTIHDAIIFAYDKNIPISVIYESIRL